MRLPSNPYLPSDLPGLVRQLNAVYQNIVRSVHSLYDTVEALVVQTITDGDSTHAPSGDAVFDALDLKYDKTGGIITGVVSHRSLYQLQSGDGAITYGGFGPAGSGTLVMYGNANLMAFRPTSRTAASGFSLSAELLAPEVTNTLDLGSTTLQWKNVRAAGAYFVGSNQVIGPRSTGWSAPTGTATKTTFDTATVTTAQLAERVKALTDALIGHGIIGA